MHTKPACQKCTRPDVALGDTHWLTQGASHLVKSAGSSGEGSRRGGGGEIQVSRSRESPMLTQQLHPEFAGTTGLKNKKYKFLLLQSKTFVNKKELHLTAVAVPV